MTSFGCRNFGSRQPNTSIDGGSCFLLPAQGTLDSTRVCRDIVSANHGQLVRIPSIEQGRGEKKGYELE